MTSSNLALAPEITEKKRIEFIAKFKEFLHENYEKEMKNELESVRERIKELYTAS